MPERKKGDFEAFFKRIFRRKITSAKMEGKLDDGWPEERKRRFSSSSEYGSRKK